MAAGRGSGHGRPPHDFDDIDALQAAAETGFSGIEEILDSEKSHEYPEGEGPLSVLILAFAIALLAILPLATSSGPESKGWWTQPWLAPLVALLLMAVAGALHVYAVRRAQLGKLTFADATRADLRNLVQPLEMAGWFALYALGIGIIGYVPSTFLFVVALLWRSNLRGPRWLLVSAAIAVALMAIFRLGLRIWLPAPELYSLLPDGLRGIAQRYF